MGMIKAGKMQGAFLPPLGIKDKAKFSTAFVLKISVMFPLRMISLFRTKLKYLKSSCSNLATSGFLLNRDYTYYGQHSSYFFSNYVIYVFFKS